MLLFDSSSSPRFCDRRRGPLRLIQAPTFSAKKFGTLSRIGRSLVRPPFTAAALAHDGARANHARVYIRFSLHRPEWILFLDIALPFSWFPLRLFCSAVLSTLWTEFWYHLQVAEIGLLIYILSSLSFHDSCSIFEEGVAPLRTLRRGSWSAWESRLSAALGRLPTCWADGARGAWDP